MPRKREPAIINEWTHFLRVDDIGDKELALTIEPDAQQKIDLARRLDVVVINNVRADLRVSPSMGGLIHVAGTLRAVVEQTCVVTLELLHNEIVEEVEGWFSDQDQQMVSFAKVKKDQQVKKAHAEVELLDESEDPESIIDGQIDLGELMTQHLSLAIDPYPHKEGVAHEYTDENQKAEKCAPRRNPFEALKDWKEKR